jgi:hypothetical protein
MTNPIKYSSNDFLTVYNDINSDTELIYIDEGIKRLFSGAVDILDMKANFIANERVLRTAISRQSVADILELIDYQVGTYSTSTGDLIFHIKPGLSYPVTILKADLAAESEGSVAVASKRFEARADRVLTAEVSETFTADAGTDELTIAGNFVTGMKVRVSTTDTLPDPLEADTDYYTIYVSSTKIRLTESLDDAYSDDYIDITDTGAGTHTITTLSFIETVYQQNSVDDLTDIGTSDETDWQEFDLPDTSILSDTLQVYINSDLWTQVESFVEYDSTDKVYKVIYKKDKKVAIRFGGSGYGMVPGNFSIEIKYSYGGGAGSNILAINKVNLYAGGNTNITGVTNYADISGGSDEEALSVAKRLAPIILKARNRAITQSDIEALSEAYAGVMRAQVNENVYGVLTMQILIIPAGGGLPSTPLKNGLKAYLETIVMAGSVDIRVEDPDYVTVNVTGELKVLPGYTYSSIETYTEFAMKLFFSEQAYEIIIYNENNPLADTIAFVNNIFATTFTVNNDGEQFQKIINGFGGVAPVNFGEDVQESNFIAFIESTITGLDFFTTSVPTFPIALDDNQVTEAGTVTLSEIT